MAEKPLVGIAGVFSGPRAAYGELLRECALMSRVPNAEYRFVDDAADPATAELAAEELVREGVKAVVGHFNSDCARAAGAVYRAADIPLLMPAATAAGLAQQIEGLRFCAPDDEQIDAIVRWARSNGLSIAGMWSDGSPYGNRLSRLAHSRSPASDSLAADTAETVTLLFGAHHRVAEELERRARHGARGLYVVGDDCAIDEFPRLIANVPVPVCAAVPVPSFGESVRTALETLGGMDLRLPAIDIKAALHALPRFHNGEDRLGARFVVRAISGVEA